MLEGINVDLEDAVDNYFVMKNLSKDRKVLKLVDSRNNWSLDRKAGVFVKSKNNYHNTIARAVVKRNTIQSSLLNFFQELNKPKIPTKFFVSQQDAYQWLISFKED